MRIYVSLLSLSSKERSKVKEQRGEMVTRANHARGALILNAIATRTRPLTRGRRLDLSPRGSGASR